MWAGSMGVCNHYMWFSLLGGMVHFWDRKTTKLLRSLRVRDECTSPASVAWNNANRDQLMFASGGDDGTIKVWTAPWNGQQVSPSIWSCQSSIFNISVVWVQGYIGYVIFLSRWLLREVEDLASLRGKLFFKWYRRRRTRGDLSLINHGSNYHKVFGQWSKRLHIAVHGGATLTHTSAFVAPDCQLDMSKMYFVWRKKGFSFLDMF